MFSAAIGRRPIKMIVGFVSTLALVLVALVATSLPAFAGGSDDPTPYTVNTSGITLPDGDTFHDGGHVNLKTSQGDKNLHFESLNQPDDSPKKLYIGKSFVPWSAFGLTGCFSVSWVQIHGYNEHHGEGGQPAIQVGDCDGGQCVVVTEQRFSKEIANSHKEYRYPVETRDVVKNSHKEWRFQTRSPLYGEIEFKDVKGYKFVDGGTVTVNGQVVSGHWEAGDSNTYYHIPGSVINAVWGSSGIPDSVLGSGTVNLSVYGGPNRTVQYKAYKETTTEGFTPWGPWSDWSTTNPGNSNDTRNVQSRIVDDPDTYTPWVNAGFTDWSTSSIKPADTATTRYGTVQSKTVNDPPTTAYYLPGGGTSDTLTEANWTTDTPSAPWTLVDTRTLPAPENCVPTPPVWVDDCGPGNGHWLFTNGDWYSFNVVTNNDGSKTITATPSDGKSFAADAVTSWTKVDSNEECPLPEDAKASIGITPPTCDAPGAAFVQEAVNAVLVGELETTPGTHAATFAANTGHAFLNQKKQLVIEYTIPGELGDCAEPDLEGSIASGVCDANAPYLLYDIVLNDPDNQVTSDTATITFVHSTDPSQNWSTEVTIGSGKTLWPGAAVDSSGNSTGWPGWAKVDGKWKNVGNGNFGWTRADNTTVLIQVDPSIELTLTVSFPPATPLCTDPPEVCRDASGNEHPKGSPNCELGSTGTDPTLALLLGLGFLVTGGGTVWAVRNRKVANAGRHASM